MTVNRWRNYGNLMQRLLQADIDDFIDQAPDGRKSIKRTGRKCHHRVD
jgi:hypothetical protein